MTDLDDKSVKDVLCSNPLAYEQKLMVNKKCRTLEELRQSFKPESKTVLDQVRNFLPRLASANEELQKRLVSEPASSIDIEHVETDMPHIEMDLALFENETDSDGDSTAEDDTDEEDNDTEVTENNLKLTKDSKRTPPVIQVLSETNSVESIPKS